MAIIKFMFTPVKIESPVIQIMKKQFEIRDKKAELKYINKFKKIN